MADQLALGAAGCRRPRPSGVRRYSLRALGHLFFRTTFGLHSTWLVNSATHLWGSRRFQTRDDSTNNWWVALLTFGEGWHNNHHAHPTSARHGLAWYEVDMNYLQIRLLKMVGLAWDLKVARIARDAREIVPQESPDAVDISEAAPVM